MAYILKTCLKLNDDEVVAQSLWILAFLSDTTDLYLMKLMALFDSKSLSQIIGFTLNSDPSIKYASIRVICNILTGENNFIQVF